MEEHDSVIGAFSEETAERLTGLSRRQLGYWDRTGFFRPAFAEGDRRQPYSRIYSFRDIVSLRVLNTLRNELKVPLQHLREITAELDRLSDDRWTGTVLYVANKRVVIDDGGRKREILGGQLMLELPIQRVISNTRANLESLSSRPASEIGKVVKSRFVSRNAAVVAGTRIPVSAIKNFAAAGYSTEQILREYPGLTAADVEAALSFDAGTVAA